MRTITSFLEGISENRLIALITAASIPLTVWMMYIQHGWVTDDTVLYLEVARLFAAGKWQEGYALYSWPFYPGIIALVHKLTSLNLQHAAQLLNVAFFAVTTYSFSSLIRLSGGDKTTIACGALLLFSSPYVVGDILPTLLRDQGFWAAMLAGFVFFIQFYRHGKLSAAILWQICASVAVLFRIEAITFLIALPLVLLHDVRFSKWQKILRLAQAWLVSILVGLLIAVAIAVSPQLSLDDFGRLGNLLAASVNLFEQIMNGLRHKADVMGEQVLGRFLDEYAFIGLIATLLLILLFKFMKSIGIWAVITLTLTHKSFSNTITPDSKRVLFWLATLAILNASIILFHIFILSTRYVVILGFLLLVFASFGLSQLLAPLNQDTPQAPLKKYFASFLLVMFILSFTINLLPKRAGHNFEQEAVAWVKNHARHGETVFYSSPRERFYAGAPFTKRNYDLWRYTLDAVEDGTIHQYDFLLINVEDELEGKTRFLIEKLPSHELQQEFYAERKKKKVVIFEKKH